MCRLFISVVAASSIFANMEAHGQPDRLADTHRMQIDGDLASQMRSVRAWSQGRFDGEIAASQLISFSTPSPLMNGTVLLHEPGAGFVVAWRFGSEAENTLTLKRVFWGGAILDRFGESVASGADVDGDGHDDVIVGAPGYDHDRGAVYIFSGATAALIRTIEGPVAGARFGESVAVARPEASQYAVVVVGSPGHGVGSALGRVYILDGSTGLVTQTITGVSPAVGLGVSVAAVEAPSMNAQSPIAIDVVVGMTLQGVGPTVRSYRHIVTPPVGSAVEEVADVVRNLGTSGPTGDLDMSSLVNPRDLEIAVDRLIASLGDPRASTPPFEEMFPLCQAVGPGATRCLRALCEKLHGHVDALKLSLRTNEIERQRVLDAHTVAYNGAETTRKSAIATALSLLQGCPTNPSVVGIVATAAGGAVIGGAAGLAVPAAAPVTVPAGIVFGAGAGIGIAYSFHLYGCADAYLQARDAAVAAETHSKLQAKQILVNDLVALQALDAISRVSFSARVDRALRCYSCCETNIQLQIPGEDGCDDCLPQQ